MITIGFSSHRAETLPYARLQMKQHQIIVLEDAPVPEFLEMLDGRLSIDEYVMTLDSGFPEFERRMCVLLRELHHEGRKIMQVEPYLEKLLQIHDVLRMPAELGGHCETVSHLPFHVRVDPVGVHVAVLAVQLMLAQRVEIPVL